MSPKISVVIPSYTPGEFAACPITTAQSVLPAAGNGQGNAQGSGANFGDSSGAPLSSGDPLHMLGQEELGNSRVTFEPAGARAWDAKFGASTGRDDPITEHIPIAGPWVSDLEVAYVAEAARDAWYRGAGTFVRRFEQSFADYVGVRHAIAVPHCTSALHLALLALGIKEGDEVIVPECSWIASAAPITYVGAQPVFADIDPTTWCISPESIERLVTAKTRALIPVGLYGLPADMPAIRKIAEKFKLHLIEDAAQSLGGKYSGKMSGTAADIAAFSFHGTKTLTTGEGGMFVTDDEAIFERAQFLRDHGRSRANYRNFLNTEVAYKYRMSDLQAAFGLAQLERIDQLLEKKRKIFQWYRTRLADVAGLALNVEPPEFVNSYWMTTVVLDPSFGLTTADIRSRFDEYGIDVRPFFHPMSSLPAYAGYPKVGEAQKGNKAAYSISPRAFNLPSALALSEAQVDRVCGLLKTFLGG